MFANKQTFQLKADALLQLMMKFPLLKQQQQLLINTPDSSGGGDDGSGADTGHQKTTHTLSRLLCAGQSKVK